jgi:hypothetical protein
LLPNDSGLDTGKFPPPVASPPKRVQAALR